MISLVAVGSGLWRYGHFGMFPSRGGMTKTALPMGAGSVVGAVVGGLLVGIALDLVEIADRLQQCA